MSIEVSPDGTMYKGTEWEDDGSSISSTDDITIVDQMADAASNVAGAANTSAFQTNNTKSKTFKVQLSCDNESVIFEASIPIGESGAVNYSTYEIVHLPTDIWAYRNTSARRFSLNGHFVSRTPEEADLNARYIDLIRSWRHPDFGGTGAVPPILRLSGYHNNNINEQPVLLTSYSVTYADDVDWIFQGTVPMPIICGIQFEFVEAYSPEEITAKAWKTKINNATGMFSYGAAATVSEAGAVGLGDSITGGLNIPNIASSGSFPGLAAMSGIGNTASNLLNTASKIAETPNPLGALGISTSNLINNTSAVQCVNPLISSSNLGSTIVATPEEIATLQNYRPGETFGRDLSLPVAEITIT